jgi:hypothetical protein
MGIMSWAPFRCPLALPPSRRGNPCSFAALNKQCHHSVVSRLSPLLSAVSLLCQGTLNLGQVEKCDRTGEFCRIVSRMLLTSRGAFDAYLVHYNQKDKPQWAVKMGSDGEDKGRALSVDPADGNVVVFGYFSGLARFGHMTIKSSFDRLDCAHGCAGFVAKYLKSGRALWVRQLGLTAHVGPQVHSLARSPPSRFAADPAIGYRTPPPKPLSTIGKAEPARSKWSQSSRILT